MAQVPWNRRASLSTSRWSYPPGPRKAILTSRMSRAILTRCLISRHGGGTGRNENQSGVLIRGRRFSFLPPLSLAVGIKQLLPLLQRIAICHAGDVVGDDAFGR